MIILDIVNSRFSTDLFADIFTISPILVLKSCQAFLLAALGHLIFLNAVRVSVNLCLEGLGAVSRMGISNSMIARSKLRSLPHDHFVRDLTHPTSEDLLGVCNCSEFCSVDFSISRVSGPDLCFCGRSSPSVVFPICQPDYSRVVNRSIHRRRTNVKRLFGYKKGVD